MPGFSRRRGRAVALAVLAAPAIALAACGATHAPSTGDAGPAVAVAPQADAPATADAGTVLTTPSSNSCDVVPTFDPAAFPATPHIDNRYLPLLPGMQFVLTGTAVGDDGKPYPHRIETDVTNLTKSVDGVSTVVVFDRDYENSVLQESEIYFEAQDRDGTVWNMGEYPEVYENGANTGAPKAWLAGVMGANPGVAMPAQLRTGTPTFSEGMAPSVQFHDCGTVVATAQRTCIAIRCYDNTAVVDEYAPLEAGDGHQEKFLAPGFGTVRVAAAGGNDPEALQMSSSTTLCGAPLATIGSLASQEDARAATAQKSLWGATRPATATLQATCAR